MKRQYLETRWNRLSDEEYAQKWMERVLSKCERTQSGCLIWSGDKREGYAQTMYRGKTVRCHRKLWEIRHNVKLPKDRCVCHTCDNRACLEQSHHWVGTWGDNLRDCRAKNRHVNGAKTHCKRGHPLSGDNLWIHGTGIYRRRRCVICSRAKQRVMSGWTWEEALVNPDPIPQNAPTKRRRWKEAA